MPLFVRRTLALSALALVVGACGDSTGSETADRGTLAFSYSGAASGQFRADGTFRRFDADDEYAVALLDRGTGNILLFATRPAAGGGEDVFAARSQGTRGTVTCTAATPVVDCDLAAELALGLNPQSNASDRFFSGTVGTMTVEQSQEGRVRGSFSFTVRNDDGTSGTAGTVQITSGTYDVALLSEPQLALLPRETQNRIRELQRAAAARP